MDRLNQLRGAEGGLGRDAALDASTPSEAYMSANESSKYFSLSDSSFDITPIKDVSLASTAAEPDRTLSEELLPNLSPITKKDVMLDSYKISKHIDPVNILSGNVNIFDDNENSFDEGELVIDDNVVIDDKSDLDKVQVDENVSDATTTDAPVDVASKDTEVVLQIDGKNVDAIDIGNGLYLYRKEGQEELAAVQIINEDDMQQPSFKFLKVRENAEGNLEVYEEFEIEVTKDVPPNEMKTPQYTPVVPVKNSNIVTESSSSKFTDINDKPAPKEILSTSTFEVDTEDKDADSKANLNGKMKFSESRKSPVVGSFTPMTYHSTPNKVRKPLTKTMVDLQLHPSRHSDNVKKTIELHTDSQSKKLVNEEIAKQKTESQVKKTDQITTGVTKNEVDESKRRKIENKNNELKNIETSEIVSNVDLKVAIQENLTEFKPDYIKLAETPDQIDAEDKITNIISPKGQNEVDTAPVHVDCSDIVHTTVAVSEITVSKVASVNKHQVELPAPKVIIPEATALVQSETSNGKPDTVKNETTTKVSDNIDSTTDGEKSINCAEAQDYSQTELKKDLTKDVVDDAKPEIKQIIEISDKPIEEKVITLMSSSSSKLDLPLSDKNKDAKQLDEVSSTSTIGLSPEPIDVQVTCESKIPEAKQDKDEKAKVQPKVMEILIAKQNEGKQELNKETEQAGSIINHKDKKFEVTPIIGELKSESNINKQHPALKSIQAKTLLLQEPNSVENSSKDIQITENKQAAKPGDATIILVEKKSDTNVTVPKFDKTHPDPKQIESKPIFITENQNPTTKTVSVGKKSFVEKNDTSAVLKIDKSNVVSVVEAKTVPKKEAVKVTESIIDPVNAKVEKLPETNVTPKANDVIIGKVDRNVVPLKLESIEKQGIKAPGVNSDKKPMNNNHGAVPFGQWTDANRQEFLNKFKDVKAPVTSNTKQIKNSNDLNRIDILKKIDSQRSNNASAKVQSNLKDTVFSSKIIPQKTETKIPVKNEGLKVKAKPIVTDNINIAQQSSVKMSAAAAVSNVQTPVQSSTGTSVATLEVAQEPTERIVNVTDLISKTIIGMLNKAPMPMTNVHSVPVESKAESKITQELKADPKKPDEDSSGSLDDIEMKMNELHGIPFVERPIHELPKVHKTYGKSKDAVNKTPKTKMVAATSKQSLEQDVIDIDSDDEVIEHEPITGDIDLGKSVKSKHGGVKPKLSEKTTSKSEPKREQVITEKDFDKFAGKNSIDFENCLTVKFDGKEATNVVQSVKEKDAVAKHYLGNKISRMDPKSKIQPKKQTTSRSNLNVPNTVKLGIVPEDPNNKNYQSKIASAYQSALSSKLQMERPITIIEDKPVKVVFMDANSDFVPNKLNVQGKELSPAKKFEIMDDSQLTKKQPLISNPTVAVADIKQDDIKTKIKHQRKQVLTPVETPELELIQPGDLTMDVSPKKKRKTDDNKTDKSLKNLVHKKQYLLGRSAAADDKTPLIQEEMYPKVLPTMPDTSSAVSAIDNLVKAAELLESQTQMKSIESTSPNSESQQSSPVKRGRGRPRKYPLPDGTMSPDKVVSPSPQKKPRLIDAKPVKPLDTLTDEEDISEGEQMIRENWTMGKINENIVCPICNKLFRSENVVFKHVKHCTGVSPTRSDSEKLSPRRMRLSRDSDNKSVDSMSDDIDIDDKPIGTLKSTPKKRKSKEISKVASEVIVIEETPEKDKVSNPIKENKYEKSKSKEISKLDSEVIVVEETPEKDKVSNPVKSNKYDLQKKVTEDIPDTKKEENVEDKPAKMKKLPKTQSSNLVCEICGKTFRQLSYLVNHRLQHKKEHQKKVEIEKQTSNLQVFSCEICKKVFRKLHHLVQHRIIHNPEVPARATRKTSLEQSDTKSLHKSVEQAPKSDDPSAGFRCEPCDKSFRKLHHLVEHRETHDVINRQKSSNTNVIDKPPPPPQCDVCKKTFRKLHHLIEHKEQHVEQVETSSEKSDDKSVKSALSTKDIIHECSLCYMVFPNEHSLTKHFIFCQQKKKRQSKSKEIPENVEGDKIEEVEEKMDEDKSAAKIVAGDVDDEVIERKQDSKNVAPEKMDVIECVKPIEASSDATKTQIEIPEVPAKEDAPKLISTPAKRVLPKIDSSDTIEVVPEKIQKVDEPDKIKKILKKTPSKDKVAPSVTRRQKSPSISALPEEKETNDDDEVRYMLNPNYKVAENVGDAFMKVRSHKRNSLQIERPSSRDLVKRRTSLQHPHKVPRLKKAAEPKPVPTKSILKQETVATDSDDSDVKYSFPEPIKESVSDETPTKKAPRKSIAEKRKSLTGIAKRKTLGPASQLKNTQKNVRIIKRRTLDVEHRCDCGQLFNSAALLTRHTSMAHTPPRIRRRRSPPPPPAEPAKPTSKPTRKSSVLSNSTDKPTRKSSVLSNSTDKPTRKSSVLSNSTDKPTRKSSVLSNSTDKPKRKSSVASNSSKPTRKSSVASNSMRKSSAKPETPDAKSEAKFSAKPKRSPYHRGVPMPKPVSEKMRKVTMKQAK